MLRNVFALCDSGSRRLMRERQGRGCSIVSSLEVDHMLASRVPTLTEPHASFRICPVMGSLIAPQTVAGA
jgi:hypothetical protein